MPPLRASNASEQADASRAGGHRPTVIRARRVQVLFPLELQRVIFLDADLVLRADLRELWTMDLKVSSAMPVQIVRPRVPH
jgi:hypothetical protein